MGAGWGWFVAQWLDGEPHTPKVGGSNSVSAICVWSLHVLIMPHGLPLFTTVSFHSPMMCCKTCCKLISKPENKLGRMFSLLASNSISHDGVSH